MRRFRGALLLLMAAVLVYRAWPRETAALEYRQVHMGMEVRIVIHADAPRSDSLADQAFARIAELEAVFSDWRVDSELRKLSAQPSGTWMNVSEPMWTVLELALDIARATDGAFDPTVGALTSLWRESARTGEPIADSARARALRSVGYASVELDSASRRVRLNRVGTRLDFGAIAKGWILDDAANAIAGDDAVLIEAGGDIVARGTPPHRRGWAVSVHTQQGDTTVVVRDGAVSTSSARAQLITPKDSAAEGHVFRTTTGRGANNTLQVAVLGPRAAVTDALATALPLMPRARWDALLARYGVRVIEGPPPDTR